MNFFRLQASVVMFILLVGAEYDEDLNDEISVQHILRDMLDKNVVEKEILNDLGFDGSKKKKDPRPKMELRHKQVQWASYKSVTNLYKLLHVSLADDILLVLLITDVLVSLF